MTLPNTQPSGHRRPRLARLLGGFLLVCRPWVSAAPGEARPLPPESDMGEPRLFNPDHPLTTPVDFDWANPHQVWVLETEEPPRRRLFRPPARADRIRILEDTDGDNTANRIRTFASGLPAATALLVEASGAWVSTGSALWWVADSDGDGLADVRRPVLAGFGQAGPASAIGSIRRGPDGWLYLAHRTDAVSAVRNPDRPDLPARRSTGGVVRFDPGSGRFEIFADGAGNPQALDVDSWGQVWVQDSDAPRVFPVRPGGIYQRSHGKPATPFAYEALPGIPVSLPTPTRGAGFAVAPTTDDSDSTRARLFETTADSRQVLVSRLQRHQADWLPSADTRTTTPIRLQDTGTRIHALHFGPDDSLWMAITSGTDGERTPRRGWLWHLPEETRSDRAEHRTPDDTTESADPLVRQIRSGNDWSRRQAIRRIGERGRTGFSHRQFHLTTPLEPIVRDSKHPAAQVAALWAMHAAGLLDDGHNLLEDVAKDGTPEARTAVARIDGERNLLLQHTFNRLDQLASAPEPEVRLAVMAAVRQHNSADPILDLPPPVPLYEVAAGGILSSLNFSTVADPDPVLQHNYWRAVEPLIGFDPAHAIGFYEEDGGKGGGVFAVNLLRLILRRAAESDGAGVYEQALLQFGKVPDSAQSALHAGLLGLLDAPNRIPSDPAARAVVANLVRHPDKAIAAAAAELGERWGESTPTGNP